MKKLTATLTRRGQVTVPAEVRRLLRLQPHEPVTFVIDDGRVYLSPAEFTWETAYGSVTPPNRPEDFDAMIRAAKDERVERYVQKLHGR